ncbi:hypothetical protein KP509_11G039200 [Ceratopteris richardii]|uniref:Uncharacterized protein n=1 Tax=Ceratopteris richardii TaxID=49495 RepID=A0A8T2TUI2_CERRI|nr:hypothetical protein KP509_11G039200 [Ceratopteris richardii]
MNDAAVYETVEERTVSLALALHGKPTSELSTEISSDQSVLGKGNLSVNSCEAVSSDVGFSSSSQLHYRGTSIATFELLVDAYNDSSHAELEVSITDRSFESDDSSESVTLSLHLHIPSSHSPRSTEDNEGLGNGTSCTSCTLERASADPKSPPSKGLCISADSAKAPAQYKGVVPQPNGRWGAQIYEKNQRVWLGTFNREEDAARAYDRAAWKYRGRHAVVNFKPTEHENAEEFFLNSLSKEQVVDLLRRHTFDDELEQSLRQAPARVLNGGGISNQEDLVGKNGIGRSTMEGIEDRSMDSRMHSSTGLSVGGATSAKEHPWYTPGSSSPSSSHNWSVNQRREHLFDKSLTPSDVGKLNRLVIPKQHAERCFPLSAGSNEKGMMLNLEDPSGKLWRFRYSYWASSQSYVFTKGWSGFVKDKKLQAGDIVCFERSMSNREELFISCRHHPTALQVGMGGASAIPDPFRLQHQNRLHHLAHTSLSLREVGFYNENPPTVMSRFMQVPSTSRDGSFTFPSTIQYPRCQQSVMTDLDMPSRSFLNGRGSPHGQSASDTVPVNFELHRALHSYPSSQTRATLNLFASCSTKDMNSDANTFHETANHGSMTSSEHEKDGNRGRKLEPADRQATQSAGGTSIATNSLLYERTLLNEQGSCLPLKRKESELIRSLSDPTCCDKYLTVLRHDHQDDPKSMDKQKLRLFGVDFKPGICASSKQATKTDNGREHHEMLEIQLGNCNKRSRSTEDV